MNSRPLKFRVWDKLALNFIYPEKGHQNHYILSLSGNFYNLQNGSGGDEYEVCQFTGLKDKEGREIYEGDIISFVGDSNFHHNQKPCVVTWIVNKFMPDDICFSKLIKVIGNIFENSELLK